MRQCCTLIKAEENIAQQPSSSLWVKEEIPALRAGEE